MSSIEEKLLSLYGLKFDPFYPVNAEQRVDLETLSVREEYPLEVVGREYEDALKSIIADAKNALDKGHFYGAFIVGRRGMGKTLLTLKVLLELKDAARPRYYALRYGMTPTELVRELYMALGCSELVSQNITETREMEKALIKCLGLKKTVAAIDQFENVILQGEDGKDLTGQLINLLRNFTNVRGLVVILSTTEEHYSLIVGTEEAEAFLRQYKTFRLSGLGSEEAITLAKKLISAAREESKREEYGHLFPFTKDAINACHKLSKGIPGLFCSLCSKVLREAAQREIEEIDDTLVYIIARVYTEEWIDKCSEKLGKGREKLAELFDVYVRMFETLGDVEKDSKRFELLLGSIWYVGREPIKRALEAFARNILVVPREKTEDILECLSGRYRALDGALGILQDGEIRIIGLRFTNRLTEKDINNMERLVSNLSAVRYGGKEFSRDRLGIVVVSRAPLSRKMFESLRSLSVYGVRAGNLVVKPCGNPAIYGALMYIYDLYKETEKYGYTIDDLTVREYEVLISSIHSVTSYLLRTLRERRPVE